MLGQCDRAYFFAIYKDITPRNDSKNKRRDINRGVNV